LSLDKSAKAARRVMGGVTRYVEGKLRLVVNRLKSKCAPLKQCAFLGFKIGHGGKVQWTEKAMKRFKEQVKEISYRGLSPHLQRAHDGRTPDGATNILPRCFLCEAPVQLGAQSRWQLMQPSRLRCLGLHSRAVSGRMWLTSALGKKEIVHHANTL